LINNEQEEALNGPKDEQEETPDDLGNQQGSQPGDDGATKK
jgi:hypothetical protein